MKKIITMALCVILTMSALLCLGISANQGTPYISIDKHTLTLKDNIWMVYFVNSQNIPEGAESGVLIWDEPQQSYTIDSTTTCGEMIYKGVQISGGVAYDRYEYRNVAARNMATDYYAVAYVKVGNEVTYSALDKYSVLQYAFNQTQKFANDPTQVDLINLLESMMDYGAASQIYYRHNTDRLPNATYYQVTVEGGTLVDGTTSGLYKEGDSITLIAPATNGELKFSHWADSADEQVSTSAVATVAVGSKNETYTAIYVKNYSEGLEYTLINNGTEYSVSGIGTCTDKDIVIPATHEGKPVTDIAMDAFYECEDITSVIIPNGVTSIGYGAFSNCTNLTSITIPDSVTSISYYAFSNCGITNLKLPNGLTQINECLFYNSSALVSVEIPASVTSIGRSAFYGCSSLAEVTFGDNVKSIGNSAFQFCTGLKSVKLGAGVESIGESAFERCSSLESIEISNKVTSIGEGAFEACIGLKSVEIPGSITSISKDAFYGCMGLTSVTINNGVESIGKYAFASCTSLTDIYMADSVTGIADYAFSGCTSLADVTIGDGVKTIGAYAFSQCGKLASITIPKSVNSIASGAFYKDSKLTTVTYKGTQAEWELVNIATGDNNSFLNASVTFSDLAS